MNDNFNKYIDMPEIAFWRDLCVNSGELCLYARGEEFCSVGECARYIGYIHSGTMKYVVYSDDGTEHVVGLEFAGEFVADFPFSINGQKARVTIVADSDCEISRYPVAAIALRLKTDETLREIIHRSTEVVFSQTYDRYIDTYCKSPTQRYKELIRRHPNLFNLFALKDIASFLNISPTHLSRLRHTI